MKKVIITIENGMVSVPQSGDMRMTAFEIAALFEVYVQTVNGGIKYFLPCNRCRKYSPTRCLRAGYDSCPFVSDRIEKCGSVSKVVDEKGNGKDFGIANF